MKRVALVGVAVVVGLSIGFVVAWVRFQPSDESRTIEAKATATKRSAPVLLHIDDGIAHWSKQGFVEMVPPIHLPSDEVEADHIAVWIRVPDGKKIAARVVDGHAVPRFPSGTTADRVESWRTLEGESVVDVRGTTLLDDAELFHVYVPTADKPKAPLVGWEWRRDDVDGQRDATNALVAHLQQTKTVHELKQKKARVVDEFRSNNNCAKCHRYDKPENLDDPRAIHRGTDDNGFYLPLSVLSDSVPLEIHRARDMNRDDPFVVLECGDGTTPILDENDAGARRYRCSDGKVPVGTLDMKAALAKNDAHALGVCASRKYLYDRMTDDARAAFARAFAECGIAK